MRFICNIAGLEQNWVEFSDVWTRREDTDLFSLPEQEGFSKYFARKCTACHIEQVGGEPITDPAQLTYDGLNDVDLRVFGFLAGSIYIACRSSQRLGNASALLSTATSEGTAAQRQKR